MKRISFFVSVFALLFLGFTSCKEKNEPNPDEEIILDGFYLYGDATALNGVAEKGMFAKGLNEADGNNVLPGLWEKYVALEANKDFVIAEVKGSTTILYGAESALVNDTTTGADWTISGAIVKKGKYVEGGTKFQVEESGVYQIVVYTPSSSVFIIPTKWRLNTIGAGEGEAKVYELTPSAFNKESMTFKLENVSATAANFKFQSYNGWKYVVDEAAPAKVNCNFGAAPDVEFKFDGTLNALQAGGTDIALARKNKAIYTVELVWNMEKGLGFSAKMTKTGTVQLDDPADYKLGLVGDAVGSWDVDVPFEYVDGTEWNYIIENQTLTAAGFKVRTIGKWDEINLGYDNVQITGDEKNFTNEEGNIKCNVETTYKTITLKYDGDTDKWTLDFQK